MLQKACVLRKLSITGYVKQHFFTLRLIFDGTESNKALQHNDTIQVRLGVGKFD